MKSINILTSNLIDKLKSQSSFDIDETSVIYSVNEGKKRYTLPDAIAVADRIRKRYGSVCVKINPDSFRSWNIIEANNEGWFY